HRLAAIREGEVRLMCAFTGRPRTIAARSVVVASIRLPNDTLYHDLMKDSAALAAVGIQSVTRIGDCLAPGTIAAAVHDGHRCAREFGAPPPDEVPFTRERIALV
ncbi:MAG: NADH:flavin oxidoreductase, partial [Dongiaceae bacterium]